MITFCAQFRSHRRLSFLVGSSHMRLLCWSFSFLFTWASFCCIFFSRSFVRLNINDQQQAHIFHIERCMYGFLCDFVFRGIVSSTSFHKDSFCFVLFRWIGLLVCLTVTVCFFLSLSLSIFLMLNLSRELYESVSGRIVMLPSLFTK